MATLEVSPKSCLSELPASGKSPKKRVEELCEGLDRAPFASKKLFPQCVRPTTRSQAMKVEVSQNGPREASPEVEIVEIVEVSKGFKGENKKTPATKRRQLKLMEAFRTPSPNVARKNDQTQSMMALPPKTVLVESVSKTKNDNTDIPTKSPGLNASHHITTPDAAAPAKKRNFFQVRKRSVRNEEKLKKEKEDADLHRRILDGVEDPRIEVKVFDTKGRGLVAKEPFQKGEFVVEYSGDLIISLAAAKKKEAFYAKHPETYGCYMYFFKQGEKTLCVDATAETKRYGRLLNHSRTRPNLRTEVIEIQRKPYLILRAIDYIPAGEELVYDYGDRSSASLAAFPWLKE